MVMGECSSFTLCFYSPSRTWPPRKMRRRDTPLLKQQSSPCLGKSERLTFAFFIIISIMWLMAFSCAVDLSMRHNYGKEPTWVLKKKEQGCLIKEKRR